MTVSAARIARRIFVLIAVSISSPNQGKIGRPGAAFVGRAGVIHRPLLLDRRRRVQILCCGIALLHVGDSHLRGKADMHRGLGLHLGQLLGLSGVQKVQLLHLAVRRRRGIELLLRERVVRCSVLAAPGPVLANCRKAVRRDRIGHLDHGELRKLRAVADRLPLQVGGHPGADRHGSRLPGCERCTRRVAVERDVHARRFAEHIRHVRVLERIERRLPLLLERKVGDVVLEHVVLRLKGGELGDKTRVARGIEDDVSDSEESEARRRCCQKQPAREQVLPSFV